MPSNRRIDVAAVTLRSAVGVMFIAHALLKYFVFTLPGNGAAGAIRATPDATPQLRTAN